MNADPIFGQLLLQCILIGLNAIFASAEIAIISINDVKLARLVAQGDKRAIKLVKLTSQPARFLATIQVAITLSGFLASAFAAENFSNKLVHLLINLGVNFPEKTLETISVVLITILLSYLTLIFGELVPKRIAMKKAEQLALSLSSVIAFIAKVCSPVVSLLTASTNGILRLMGINPNDEEETITEEEIRMMVDAGSKTGAIELEEKNIIQNVFEFNDITAGEIAIHRTEAKILWMEDMLKEEWDKTINESRHSLYPICQDTIDNVIGVLNAKDYFRLKEKTIEHIMSVAVKTPYFIPATIRADILFRTMQKNRKHFAIVLDEYGGMTGIVTMNDLLEQLVGDLDNETTSPQSTQDIQPIDSRSWQINGNTELDEISEKIGLPLRCDEYDTLNGLVFGTYGHIPDDGSQIEITFNDILIKVTEIKNHRVGKAIISRL